MLRDLPQKIGHFKARGWQPGDTTAFLGLSEQEAALVELSLARAVVESVARSRNR